MDVRVDARHPGTVKVACRGRLLHGTAPGFWLCVAHVIGAHRRAVLDLGGVTHMDARGVGALAALVVRARAARRQMVLATPAGRAGLLLGLTRLDTQVECLRSPR